MRRKTSFIFLVLVVMLLFSSGMGVLRGAVRLSWQEVFAWPLHPVIGLRLMRIAAALIAGSGLAVCGVVLQAVLRNPLADPYLLGTSSGAGLGAVIALSLGFSSLFLPAAGFIGALGSLALVYSMASRQSRISGHSLILAGVIVSVGLSAVIVFLVTFSVHEALHGMTWWLWGSLRVYDLRLLALVAAVVIPGVCFMYAFSQDLNAMSIGDEEAVHLGIPVERVKKILLFAASLVTAAIVCICGIIGFVGLMIPHMMRLVIGPNHRRLIPASCLAAAVFMIFSDFIARTAFVPLELPIGVITALIGAPVFIILMQRSARL